MTSELTVHVLISFADTDMMDDLITQESKSEGCPNNSNVDAANMYFVQCVRACIRVCPEKPSLSGDKHLYFCMYVVVFFYIKNVVSVSLQLSVANTRSMKYLSHNSEY